jgi:regulatory protein
MCSQATPQAPASEQAAVQSESLESSTDPDAAYRAALDSAVRSLGQREHSGRELELKLRRKGHDPQLIERVMRYLLEHDLQSDARFAEALIRSRVQRGYGPMKIRQELGAKGVAEGILEDQLTEPSEFWSSVAEASLAKKFGQPPQSRDDWAVQARFLARRGFPSDLIYRVLGSQTD